MNQERLYQNVKLFPDTPGVYRMYDDSGIILYIGKAASLRKRVLSYFQRQNSSPLKENFFTSVQKIDYLVCDTEAQAFLLERALIKEEAPRYNTALKDDKSFPWIEISDDNFPFMRIVRRPPDNPGSVYFGPYPNSGLLRDALKIIRKIFPFRSCRRFPQKPCLYYHLHLCPGVCAGMLSQRDYAVTIQGITCILKGERKELLTGLESSLLEASKNLKFEKAALLRDRYFSLANLYGACREFAELLALKEVLGLSQMPAHIEGVDISHISGFYSVGSIVVFRNGVPERSEYRRFRIKGAKKNDDYGAISEVVRRRYQRMLLEARKLPDLLIIDGGSAQLSAVLLQLRLLGLESLALVSIAKRKEELYRIMQGKIVRVSGSPGALRIIQRVRDEAHRFAHRYHLLLRQGRIHAAREKKTV